MAKAPAPKKEKNPPPVEEKDDDFKKDREEAGAAPKGRGNLNLKLIIMIVAAMVVGIGGTVVVMKLLGSGSPPPPAAEAEAPAETETAPPPVAPQRASSGHGGAPEAAVQAGEGESAPGSDGSVNIKFDTFIVNLTDIGGRSVLKLTFSVDAETQELADEINAKMPRLKDTILTMLSSLQSDDISGSDGKLRLKHQMISRINPNLSRGKIRDLFYSEFVVQK